MKYCRYCGYEFSEGTAKTLTVNEYYSDRFYEKYDSINRSYENMYKEYSYGLLQKRLNTGTKVSTETILILIAGIDCVLLLLILAILIIVF